MDHLIDFSNSRSQIKELSLAFFSKSTEEIRSLAVLGERNLREQFTETA